MDENGDILGEEARTPTHHTHHTRSHSDTKLQPPPQLSPSPKFKEPAPKVPRDDSMLIATPPKMPRRETLSLQMPPRDTGHLSNRSTPMQSPQVERDNTFESPTSMLPRHSRGMDFSRACTNLHHSTLPDQSSPDSSPKISHKGLKIPSRRQSTVSSMMLDSPRTSGSNSFWADKSFRPRSLGSTTAMTSEASSSDSNSDEEMKSRYDPDEMLSTPTVHRQSNSGGAVTPYSFREEMVAGGALHNPSPASRRFAPYKRNARGGGRLAALRTQHLNGTEDNTSSGSSTDQNEMLTEGTSRRQSISAVTGSLHISTGSNGQDSDNEGGPAAFKFNSPSVVRRPVTRRSNLLPKSKGFARIRAQLIEESSPVDSDMKRDAEVVRQVRVGSGSNNFIPNLSHQSTASSSPDLTPTVPQHPMDGADMSDLDGLGVTLPTTEGPTPATANTANDRGLRRSSSSRELFSHLFNNNSRFSTPPPNFGFLRHRSSSGLSDDTRMDSPATLSQTTTNTLAQHGRSESEPERDSQPPFQPANMPTAAEVTRKANAKRRRDDDFDPSSIKRRAVSPGMSVHSSPVMGQSPVSTTGGWWTGKGKESRDGSQKDEGRENRSASMGSTSGAASGGSVAAMAPPSTPNLGARRVGLQQGMSDTSEGLVRMSLE